MHVEYLDLFKAPHSFETSRKLSLILFIVFLSGSRNSFTKLINLLKVEGSPKPETHFQRKENWSKLQNSTLQEKLVLEFFFYSVWGLIWRRNIQIRYLEIDDR